MPAQDVLTEKALERAGIQTLCSSSVAPTLPPLGLAVCFHVCYRGHSGVLEKGAHCSATTQALERAAAAPDPGMPIRPNRPILRRRRLPGLKRGTPDNSHPSASPFLCGTVVTCAMHLVAMGPSRALLLSESTSIISALQPLCVHDGFLQHLP